MKTFTELKRLHSLSSRFQTWSAILVILADTRSCSRTPHLGQPGNHSELLQDPPSWPAWQALEAAPGPSILASLASTRAFHPGWPGKRPIPQGPLVSFLVVSSTVGDLCLMVVWYRRFAVFLTKLSSYMNFKKLVSFIHVLITRIVYLL